MHDKSSYQRGKNQVSPGIEIANHPDLNLICILMISLHANPRLSGCLATWGGGGQKLVSAIRLQWFHRFLSITQRIHPMTSSFYGSLKAETGSIWWQKQTQFITVFNILSQQREPVKCGQWRAHVRAQILTFARVTLNWLSRFISAFWELPQWLKQLKLLFLPLFFVLLPGKKNFFSKSAAVAQPSNSSEGLSNVMLMYVGCHRP